MILAPNKLLTRSSLHCTAPRAPAPPLSPTEGEGLEHTLRHFSTNLEEATPSVERTKDELVGKRKSSGSVIWRWFGFKVSDEQQNHVICRQCHKQVTARGGSTTNLFHHLKQWHKLQYEGCVKLRAAEAPAASHPQPAKAPAPKQNSLQASFSRSVPYEKKSDEWCTITKAVTYRIAKDVIPVATVEQVRFKKSQLLLIKYNFNKPFIVVKMLMLFSYKYIYFTLWAIFI